MASMQTVNINAASDGTGAAPAVRAMVRNDAYFLEKIAERLMKEQGALRSGVTYRLSQLPAGYGGYEKARDGSKHVDRYLYGHPNGVFRSLNEIWPHFKHLQEFGGSVGCPCKLCTGTGKGSKKKSGSNSIAKPALKPEPSSLKTSLRNENPQGLPQGRLDSNSPVRSREKPTDEEGTPDLYRNLLDQLQEAGSEHRVTENIIDQLSPDWRAGNELLQSLLNEWQSLPKYMPRIGEIVLFARNAANDAIAWDASCQSLRHLDTESRSWLDRLKWEAGVVTQMPIEQVKDEDLLRIPDNRKQNITYSGFRIEPFPEPSNEDKPYTKQHKYVPLHAIRPFSFWKECMGGLAEQDSHPTVKHALTIASSFSLVGKYSFKGMWPEATLFVRGVYLGPELVMVGDAVRLAPTDTKRPVTDVMIISSIRLRFVDQASGNDYDDGSPYLTCLHICGRAFTLNPKKSSDGIAKAPVKPGEYGLPAWFKSYGQWFHALDAANEKAKLEVPYHRVLGRCFEDSAVKAWFSTPDIPPASSFQAVNSAPINKARIFDFSHGLEAAQEARKYSRERDSRIDRAAGKSWFWADTRIEQLDLHEVNGAFVGAKDETRSKKQVNAWRQALKVMDGMKGSFEEYHAARNQRLDEEKRRESAQVNSSSWGLMGSAAKVDSTDGENGRLMEDDAMEQDATEGSAIEGDAMELDDDQLRRREGLVVDLTEEMEDEEMSE